VAAPSDNSPEKSLNNLLPLTGEGIIIDIGTGDGRFVYESARENPNKFYIGIDASVQPLKKISEKIHRKPTKGGAPNVLFVQASVEDLPTELEGIADEIHIHFPWGSLLRVVATGNLEVLKTLRALCAANALLEVVTGLDPTRDATEIERLGLDDFTVDLIDKQLVDKYLKAGFEIFERGTISPSDWPELKSSWAKCLKGRATRSITYFIAKAT
jgi:16S rRNA (adenine(1408)-N(1))-methyltransferase